MLSKVRKFGRVQVIGKDGTRHHFEVSDCDGELSITKPFHDMNRRALKTKMPQSQDPPPVEPPPNEPQKPPVKEPPSEDPNRKPPPSPNPPPVEPPPNEPQKPPVKEPPPKDPDRKPPYEPPVRAARDAAEGMALGA